MNKNKEIERLKWEYLKRSDRFWETWKYIRSTAPPPADREKLQYFVDAGEKGISEYANYIEHSCAIAKDNGDHFPHPEVKEVVCGYYCYLANNEPEAEDFDAMWQENFVEHKPLYEYLDFLKQPVEDYRKRIGEDIDRLVLSFQNNMKRNPSIEELKKNMSKLLNNEFPHPLEVGCNSTYLVITQEEKTEKELKALLKDISARLKRNVLKKKRIRMDEYIRYLKVFDLKKENLKWKDIGKIIYPHKKYDESMRISLIADRNKAKRLIKDVETGKF